MSRWNYVVTAHKPTIVTHSCVGYFTDHNELNLIVGKSTRIEIHLVTPHGLRAMLDVPIYGRIATLELFRPQRKKDLTYYAVTNSQGESKDLLFIATERNELCVLQWDSAANEIITRQMRDVSDRIRCPTPAKNGQIGIIDPDCGLIGLHLYDELFKVIPFDNKGQLGEAFNIGLEELQVLDIKFLYGCPNPTIVVLYQDSKDARHVKTYEVAMDAKKFVDGPWAQTNFFNGADLLVPVPPPLCGVLIIGEEIVYRSASTSIAISVRPSITKAYGRIDADGSRYLLGDHNGLMHLLRITHENEKVTGLKIEQLGETSLASSISYLDNDTVFVGSSYGDSQLIKLDLHSYTKGSCVEVLECYDNLGPIVDFCVVDLESQGQGQVVTCSGAYKDGSLRIVRSGIMINEQSSVELQGIKGMWSLRSATDDPYDMFLVVSFISETRILAMNNENVLEETKIEGFRSQVRTLHCHDVVYDQLVQVTSNSVRLVRSTSRELLDEWFAPTVFSVNIATANATQVLLALGGCHLVYIDIGDGVLTEVKQTQLEYDISCLDINPIGDNPNCSTLAAVGTCTDISVRIYSLPDLNLIITKKPLGGEIIPRSVLMCSFEGISYLLCGLEDGHLFNFVLNISTGELADRKKVSLGTQPVTLRTFSSKNAKRVFAASDRPIVIYSSNKKLHYSNVNSKEVNHMCSFNSAAFPESIAIAKEGELTIGTIDKIQKLHIRSIPLDGEHARRICHQEQTSTFAICSLQFNQTGAEDKETHFIRLLDAQTFDIISSYRLGQFERGCSIVSCSFSDDTNVYYCIGTGFEMPGKYEPSEGRILVFVIEDGKLKLIAEKETNGVVYSLNAFKGKLLAAINQKIQLYEWMLDDFASRKLQFECEHHGHILALYVKTRDDFIVVGDLRKSISLLIYKPEKHAIEELVHDYDYNNTWMSAFEIIDDDIYLCAESNYNIFAVRKKSAASINFERGFLEVVGEYHLGEFVNGFRHGSLVTRRSESDVGQIPTVIFGTANGVIGMIASLPHDQYLFLDRLQTQLRKVVKGVGGLSHEKWRSFYNGKKTMDSKSMLDGDLIESFLDLGRIQMEDIARELEVPMDELTRRVEELMRLH